MNGNDDADDTRLLSVAAAISRGDRVDWDGIGDAANEDQARALDELRALDGLARRHPPAPPTWGAFTILFEIGRGAFGTVYSAIDPALELHVALKVIRTGSAAAGDPADALREARALARVDHPNIVRVHRAETDGTDVGIAMELVTGLTLADLIARDGPMSAGDTMAVARDLCRALGAVHGAGIVHGDIKARNVMRTGDGRTVLMDFSACRFLEAERCGPERVAGTPLYLAPELFTGLPQSPASDIYSLGILMYHLATGRYPVEGRDFTEIARRHGEHRSRQPIRDLAPALPEAFVRIVDRATAREPDARYGSAAEFQAAIDQALGSGHRR